MGCCGEKRASLRQASASPPPAGTAAPVPPPTSNPRHHPATSLHPHTTPASEPRPHGLVRVTYTEQAPIRVVGAATGLPYEFSTTRTTQLVHPSDAAVLLRTALFHPA